MRRDFTGRALFTFLLYFCFWAPGFVVNIILLTLAWDEKDQYGEVPGWGCLVTLFWICGIGVPAVLGLVYYGITHLY